MGDLLCSIIILSPIFYIIWRISEDSRIEREREEKQKKVQEERQQQERLRIQTNNNIQAVALENSIKNTISRWWKFDKNLYIDRETIKTCYGYNETFKPLQNDLKKIEKLFFTDLKKEDAKRISDFYINALPFFEFISNCRKRFSKLPESYMMEGKSYGMCKGEFKSLIKNLNREKVDQILRFYNDVFHNKKLDEVNKVDTNLIASCMWYYAMNKPFDAEQFHWSARIYQMIHREYNILELFIAELYAICQMGSMDLLKTKVSEYIEHCQVGGFVHKETQKYICNVCGCISEGKRIPDNCPVCGASSYHFNSDSNLNINNNSAGTEYDLPILASALMWMGAYEAEEMVLKFMFERHIQMSSKLQERLHSLSNRKGIVPDEIKTKDNKDGFYFDISSISWKEEDYAGFFDNLSFKDKLLSYALVIREDNKALTLNSGYKLPPLERLTKDINKDVFNEYGDTVECKKTKYIAVSGSNEQEMKGILVGVKEYSYMAVFMYLIPIGKKLNIKFYTLFLPTAMTLSEQRQQAKSLIRKMNPDVTMWEDSLKETVLFSIQKILNHTPINLTHDSDIDDSIEF